MNQISSIKLYKDLSSKSLDLGMIKDYLTEVLNISDIDILDEFVACHADPERSDEIAKMMAGIKVRDLNNPDCDFQPLYGEIQFEKKALANPEKRMTGVLYDGFGLSEVFQSLMRPDDIGKNDVHIAFTGRLFGTFDEDDRRYHARVIVCGYPSIISTTGIVEAPAKPREFYRLKNALAMVDSTRPPDDVKEEFRERFIDIDDERLTDVMKGYVMQAVFYHMTGQPFCKDSKCRLFNAHWQEELIEAQLSLPEFCSDHEEMISEFNQL